MKTLSCASILWITLNVFCPPGHAQNYWHLGGDGSIGWSLTNEERLPHTDNIEMSGSRVSAIIHYTVNRRKQLEIRREIIFPQLRTYDKSNGPEWQRFRAYRKMSYAAEIEPNVVDKIGQLIFDKVDSVKIDGKLIFYHAPVRNIVLVRTLFPSMSDRLFVEKWTLVNNDRVATTLRFGKTGTYTQIPGPKGEYYNKAYCDATESVRLLPGESYSFGIYFGAALNEETMDGFNYRTAEEGRDAFLKKMREHLVLKTNNPVLDQLFYFSKIRAAESIFESKMGLVHSPGGENYYLGIWANDQAEYSGPFFPLLGYDKGLTAAANAYKMFLKHIPKGDQTLPRSFEIEGDIVLANKDRGDAAMVACGASLYLLRTGDKDLAKELWPLVEWTLDYCNRKLNARGVVTSETDEMEGRIATGTANLATSSLYYGGLIYGSYLAQELGYHRLAKTYSNRRKALAKNIESYFGHRIEGLDTYRYFDGNENLRHWIGLPLVMGIPDRANATATALLDKLWTENGVLVELNPETKNNVFWDRGTLYVLRGTFKAGFTDKSMERLDAFSTKRLLGNHVPYVIEAYPENNMRHLSAESALYCRMVVEGILGLEQTGFNSVSFTPRMNAGLSQLTMDNLHLGAHVLSIDLSWTDGEIQATIVVDGKTVVNTKQKSGSRFSFSLK